MAAIKKTATADCHGSDTMMAGLAGLAGRITVEVR